MRRPLFTIVAPIVVRHDAISASVRNTFKMVSQNCDCDVALLTARNEYDDLPADIVRDVTDVLRAPSYMNADVLFYSFGVYNPLFDCMLIGNGKALQICRFHNITPAELLPSSAGELIEKSFVQLNNVRNCDRIWPDSQFNSDVLCDLGFDERKIKVIPLVVEKPSLRDIRTKSRDKIEFLFVGRAVRSKGLLDCIHALAEFAKQNIPFKLSIVGNLSFSDAEYLAQCRALIAKNNLGKSVEILGTHSDEGLDQLYARAQVLLIPSYHEGFCVPVVEALRSGCIPIGYSAGNLPYIVNKLGRLVPAGNIEALSAAISEIALSIYSADGKGSSLQLPLEIGQIGADQFSQRARDYVGGFSFERISQVTAMDIRQSLGL